MSRLLASVLILSSRLSGSLMLMLLVLGFKLGNLGLMIALSQSKYSVLSWVAQKSLSSSSVLKSGMVLSFFGIFFPFFFVLISS